MATHSIKAWVVLQLAILLGMIALSYQKSTSKSANEDEFLDSFTQWLRKASSGKIPFSGVWVEDGSWPEKDPKLGQIAGVSTDKQGNVVVLHRASRSWEAKTFSENNTFTGKPDDANPDPTVVKMNRNTGEILESWGENLFFMPHGLEIDQEGNYWITDVALHQVFKLSPNKEVLLTLGKAFEPAQNNQDKERFCKPTDVAVATNGDFFVSDGYCNSRIIKYNKDGEIIDVFGQGDAWVPHSLALVEELDMICVADRENKRILCYNAGIKEPRALGYPEREFMDEDMLGKVYAITYCSHNGYLYVVSAPTGYLPGAGLTIDLRGKGDDVIAAWGPKQVDFQLPHDLEITEDGTNLYVGEIEPHKVWKFNQKDSKIDEGNQE